MKKKQSIFNFELIIALIFVLLIYGYDYLTIRDRRFLEYGSILIGLLIVFKLRILIKNVFISWNNSKIDANNSNSIISYLQYKNGPFLENISPIEIKEAIEVISKPKEQFNSFWIGVIENNSEVVISISKEKTITFIHSDREHRTSAKSWNEVESILNLLIDRKYDEILVLIKA